jgi:hypothetical protein
MKHTHFSWLMATAMLFGCGDDDIAMVDAGFDAGSVADGGRADTGTPTEDGGRPDAPMTSDAGPDPLDVDDDGDGFSENEGDSNDADATVSPGATEICDNMIDDDCDTVVDDVGGATMVGPTPYLQASDSPWASTPFEMFVLEDFEDQTLPDGVMVTTFRWSSSFSLAIVDSVDGDDGDPTNGTCNPCEAMWSSAPITFTFDPAVLGGLPTHVGLVMTDASSADLMVTLSATSACASLGDVSSSIAFGDGSIAGETAEDRFIGVESPAGITSVTVSAVGAFEVDHLQFGW